MAQNAKLTTFDHEGETIRERQVAFWYIRDGGESEEEEGLYISLSSTADLTEEVSPIGVGVTITADALRGIGYYRAPDLLDEETLLSLGYVKTFPSTAEEL